MPNIIGTTICISHFLGSAAANLVYTNEGVVAHTLPCGRRMFVPYYQREIRWRKENITTLMQDIESGDKFLGNIILSKKGTSEYEIVDGQQRTTALIMLLVYFVNSIIYNRPFSFCDFEICSFPKFDILKDKQFKIETLTPVEIQEIDANDDYGQKSGYVELYKCIVDFLDAKNNRQLSTFYANLTKSEVNLIISTDIHHDLGMDFFLDVNLKALPLDTEDVFKGYFFKEAIDIGTAKAQWSDLKKAFNVFNRKLLEKTATQADPKKQYTLSMLLEHYIRSTLHFFKTDYVGLTYSSDFKLTQDILDNATLAQYYAGDHLINAIKDSAFLTSLSNGLVKYLNIVTDVISTGTPSDYFTAQFKCLPTERIDNDTIALCHYMIKNVLLGADNLPKALMLKYCISVFDGQEKSKDRYKDIFTAFLLSIFFSVFEIGRKNITIISEVLKAHVGNWVAKATNVINEYIDSVAIEENILLKKFRIHLPEEKNQFLAKALAGVYNFFRISGNVISISNEAQAKEFFTNAIDYSTEHLFLNDSGKIQFYKPDGRKDGSQVPYPLGLRQARDSIFNFIFLKKTINTEVENKDFITKLSILSTKDIVCEYSLKVLELARTEFGGCVFTRDDAREFFAENGEFIRKYKNLANSVFNEIVTKFRSTH
jgi:hypothetical protein